MKKTGRRYRYMERARQEFHANKFLSLFYVFLRVLVVGILIAQIFNRNYNDVFMCVMTLFLFTLPSFVERRLKIDVPDTLEVIILLFIFAAEILGEISEYYIAIPYWDSILHTINGFLCAAIGLAMIDILNRSERFSFKMSPIFVAFVAFCFSMTIGVMWEIFEYAADVILRTDMQKDTLIKSISTVLLHPAGRNIPVIVNIESVVINGEVWPGYIDIGLIDTMVDLIVNFVGAFIFSVIGYFYIKHRGKPSFVSRLLLTKIVDKAEPGGDDLPDKGEKIDDN